MDVLSYIVLIPLALVGVYAIHQFGGWKWAWTKVQGLWAKLFKEE